MDLQQNFETAARSLRGNRLRTGLTVAIIAVGIMSIVGIQTALDIMSDKIAGSFSKMGADVFTLRSKQGFRPLGLREAEEFAGRGVFASQVCVSAQKAEMAQVKSASSVTDPVVSLTASDESFLKVQMIGLSDGRNFTSSDKGSGSHVAIVGDNVRRKLFGDASGVGETILVADNHYTVVGAFQRQGAMFGTGVDNSVLVPLGGEQECSVSFLTAEGTGGEDAFREARMLMRSIRRLSPLAEDDFVIEREDTMQDKLASLKEKLSMAALAIGLVTMLCSAIGLMNIMLVCVKERTSEIGVRKAVGASPSAVRRQFLAEAVLIGQIGCAVGIALGILFGNLVALAMEGEFTVPWNWVGVSVAVCFAVSLLSGYIPARRAAALPPIEALRCE